MERLFAVLVAGLALAAPAFAADDVQIRLGDKVVVSEAIEGSLNAAGGRIVVEAPVEGDASLAGGSITVKGAVRDHLRAAGGHVTIDGPIGGNVSVMAGKLDLGPDAHIGGTLTFHGGDLRRDPSAVVVGKVEQTRGRVRHHHRVRDGSGIPPAFGWIWTAGLLVLAALIAAALPGPSKRMASELRERPWLTPLVGIVALVTIPVAALLLMITIIGIPIGLLAIAAYFVLLLVGYVWLAVVIGGLLLDRVKPETAALATWRAGFAVLAMLVLALFTRIPFLGGLIALTALVVGVGMIVAVVARRATTPAAAPAA